MRYVRMPIEVESPEEYGYGNIRHNLSESSVADRTIGGLGLAVPDLTLLYGEHRGSERLRALIAEDAPGLSADDVLVTGGAATALFIISTSLLGAGDHLVVIRPNYATNIETPRAIGCDISFIDLAFENGFRIDLAALEAAITPRTRFISVTCPHNPTGVSMPEVDLRSLVGIAAKHGCYLLVDETYRDLCYDVPLPLAASLGSHVISVSSLSKAYGIPGIRIGWLITSDPKLQELFLAAKEQISICGSVVDEWIAEQVMERRHAILKPTLIEMKQRLARITEWMAGEELLEWVPPQGGVVCFPRMRADPPGGTEGFYRRLLEQHGTYVGPGHWFEMPDSYFRLGYGWPERDSLEAGLEGISRALRD
ncbi:pyridoxal phosphate-dependent aminotransferase [Sphingomonas sp. AOB5]|uniref:pyridoxal phosphate-dependent aminotransferase n=1 Tax=Sphingomonas sp. AOB5 TaxID=3034017 RepID=UPI0023F9F146|nr:pyridoxal phosphate-dependent aminotransferase [Sphingomonas sp. AOB5]MDF7777383.1 pyridoxal phosphate-dependent aminotransferase [Sphingomonas sp. AOB5]